ncbi:hypothetical protein NQ317_007446 [Molorchus minor]|uniref:Uncharacterized protein n=1 Tax=Molorchus minor TaxID=1323400 RepID=A0ABQ9JGN5_9CUCU|nr:hypothetical protein NQ317_007446 [Molorchus minor]
MFFKLGIPSTKITHSVEGFGSNITTIFEKVHHRQNISKSLQAFSFNNSSLQIPQNIVLADKTFNQPGPVDMLLGASTFWQLICVVSGTLPLSNSICNLSIDTTQNLIQEQLKRFWRIEEISSHPKLSQEESECESEFVSNTTRDELGGLLSIYQLSKICISSVSHTKQQPIDFTLSRNNYLEILN